MSADTCGPAFTATEALHLRQILDSKGLDHAHQYLCAVKGHRREIRLYAVWCARQVQHLVKDQRSIAALDVAERHANGRATDDDLAAARATSIWLDEWPGSPAWHAAWAAKAATWPSNRPGHAAAWSAFYAVWAAGDFESIKQKTELRRLLDCVAAGQDPYPVSVIKEGGAA